VFGSPAFAREELVAEMTAAMICGVAGIAPVGITAEGDEEILESSAAYLQHWMEVLRADSRVVVIAAARAQKATDYILARRQREESQDPSRLDGQDHADEKGAQSRGGGKGEHEDGHGAKPDQAPGSQGPML
jgi:antirestriction protein ArdC